MKFQPGDSVHYVPDHAKDNPEMWENGVVKSLGFEPDKYFVVYNCNGEWHKYQEYTAALTDLNNLRPGWDNRARNNKQS
jgi:hypothetical protein